jgi:hypothetical protein
MARVSGAKFGLHTLQHSDQLRKQYRQHIFSLFGASLQVVHFLPSSSIALAFVGLLLQHCIAPEF